MSTYLKHVGIGRVHGLSLHQEQCCTREVLIVDRERLEAAPARARVSGTAAGGVFSISDEENNTQRLL